MMSWPIALAFNLLVGTIRTGVQKKILNSLDPLVFLFWVLCYMLPLFVILYIIQYHSLPTLYPEMFLLGILFSISASCGFAAIKISLSQTTIVGTYSMAISMILAAIFLGESGLFDITTYTGQKTIAGLVIASISLYFLSSSKRKKHAHMTRHWLLLVVCFLVTDGVGQFWNKLFLTTHIPLEALVSQLVADVPFMYLILRLRKVSLHISAKSHQWVAIDSILEVGFAIFLLTAYKIGPLSIILPIQKLGTIIGGLLIGFVFFKETNDYSKTKFFGLGLGILGIVLLII